MHIAALIGCLRHNLAERGPQPRVIVGHHGIRRRSGRGSSAPAGNPASSIGSSQPIERVINLINPVLRGWVNYFAVGHSSECFSFIKDWARLASSAASTWRLPSQSMPIAISTAWLAITPASRTRS